MTMTSTSSSFNFVKDTTPEKIIRKAIPLTPNAKRFRAKYDRLRRLHQKTKYSLSSVQNFVKSKNFHQVTRDLTRIQKDFILLQLKSSKRKPKGRRYLNNEKVLAFFKQSGRAYKFLSHLLALPSIRTLQNLLSKVPIVTGISLVIISSLKKMVTGMSKQEKYFTLLWDEMSLEPHLDYNRKNDLIEGFEDFQHLRTKRIADHVLVFMIRSVTGPKKQPVAYYFCESSTKSPQLVRCIKAVYKALVSTGLNIVATVCDQSSTNQAAINMLRKDTARLKSATGYERNTIEIVPGKEVVVLFDVPHLLKGIRNNLLTKDLEYYDEQDVKRYASWKHIVQFYNYDTQFNFGNERLVSQLNDSHIVEHKMNKMKVSDCAKVLSNRLGKLLSFTARATDAIPDEA